MPFACSDEQRSQAPKAKGDLQSSAAKAGVQQRSEQGKHKAALEVREEALLGVKSELPEIKLTAEAEGEDVSVHFAWAARPSPLLLVVCVPAENNLSRLGHECSPPLETWVVRRIGPEGGEDTFTLRCEEWRTHTPGLSEDRRRYLIIRVLPSINLAVEFSHDNPPNMNGIPAALRTATGRAQLTPDDFGNQFETLYSNTQWRPTVGSGWLSRTRGLSIVPCETQSHKGTWSVELLPSPRP